MSDYLRDLRETQFRNFKPEPLTDQEPIFALMPATISDLSHFAAKHKAKINRWGDSLFILGACVGIVMQDVPVICGVIQVGRPTTRHIGDSFDCQIKACVHDLVPGVRRFLVAKAIHASRALGFHRLLLEQQDEHLRLESGFVATNRGWMLDLAHEPVRHEGQERIALPGKPPLDSIDIP